MKSLNVKYFSSLDDLNEWYEIDKDYIDILGISYSGIEKMHFVYYLIKPKPYKLQIGDKLLINTEELQDEEVTIIDLTSDGVPFCGGDNFEDWIPIFKVKTKIDK